MDELIKHLIDELIGSRVFKALPLDKWALRHRRAPERLGRFADCNLPQRRGARRLELPARKVCLPVSVCVSVPIPPLPMCLVSQVESHEEGPLLPLQ